MDNRDFMILLDSIGVKSAKICEMWLKNRSKINFYEEFCNNPDLFNIYMSQKQIIKIKNAIEANICEKNMIRLQKYGVKTAIIGDSEYPEKLLRDLNPPMVLYYIGNIDLLKQNLIGVVGTRSPSNYGTVVAQKFVREMVDLNFVTVSGLAYGIDGIVASETLSRQGKTIAVLAGGLDSIYPASHENLAKQIVKSGGLLLSEHMVGVKPFPSFFLDRNRIISGVSDGLLLVEAGEKSGTLSTAHHAERQGVKVFAIPGSIASEKSKGTNTYIKSHPESMVLSAGDIFEKLGVSSAGALNFDNQNKIKDSSLDEKISKLDDVSKSIIITLKNGELSFDEIIGKTKISSKSLVTLLTSLEINGLIKKLPGNYYELVH